MSIGNLELIIGPMYAGKSTELLRKINMYEFLDKNIIVINHVINNRYGSSNLSTHNKEYYDKSLQRIDELVGIKKFTSNKLIDILK